MQSARACVRCTQTYLGARALPRRTSAALTLSLRYKGDYGFNVFHNSNPQHGGSYARHERRMRDDEVEDFLRSVKGWSPVRDTQPSVDATVATGSAEEAEAPPEMSPLQMGEEAIMRTFHFEAFRDAYLFMGRFWAFCYGSDKYPNVTWDGCDVTIYLYSPSFRGLSKREARMAAFLNDQYNMFKKSQKQQQIIAETITKSAAVEEFVGESVGKSLADRERLRRAPLPEARDGPTYWEELLAPHTR